MKLSNSPAFKDVDPDFVNRLENTLNTASHKNSVEVIGVLMQISNEANRRNIPFTPDMQVTLMNYFKNQLPRNQRAQFEAIINVYNSQRNK